MDNVPIGPQQKKLKNCQTHPKIRILPKTTQIHQILPKHFWFSLSSKQRSVYQQDKLESGFC